MTKVIFISTFLVALAQFALSQTSAPVTTNAPVTSKSVHVNHNNDPKLETLMTAVAQLETAIRAIDKLFELEMVIRNPTELNKIVDKTKVLRKEITVLKADIKLEIAQSPTRTFLNRLSLEYLRIQVQKYNQILKWIALEILGDQTQLSRFENYKYSETLSIVHQMVLTRWTDMMLNAFEADKLIQEANEKDPLHGKVDQATKAKIDQHFKAVITSATDAKLLITKDAYEEFEKLRLDNAEINLYQRMTIEGSIDMLNFAVQFVTKYEELFLRINV